MVTPDTTADLPWHIAQVYALTDNQQLDLLLSFYATYQAITERLDTAKDPLEQKFATLSRLALDTVLASADLPTPKFVNRTS